MKMDINNITKEDIISAGKKYYKIENDKRITRFKAWSHCHEAFKEARKKYIKKEEIDIEYLCLQLSAYLASWGMYRNSFILWSDYKIHRKVIKELLKDDYQQLWEISIEKYNNKEMIDLLEQLKNKMIEYYTPTKESVDEFLVEYKNKKISSNKAISKTLISKILLGTLACTPAYDKYFKTGVISLKDNTGVFDKTNFIKLINNKKVKESIEEMTKTYPGYPQMKLLDSCFWQLGYDIEKNRNK